MRNLRLIRGRINQSGKTHRQIARAIGVHPTTLSRFLNGKTDMNSTKFVCLLRILDMPTEDLNLAS